MIDRVRLSFCWWKTVLHTSQSVLHSRSLAKSHGMVHSDRRFVDVVSYGDHDLIMLWIVDVVEKLCG
jgi:hypothetical protein